jgi:hypothetical protein
VSSTLDRVEWNAELVRGDVGKYEFVVQPRLVGHGPTLFACWPESASWSNSGQAFHRLARHDSLAARPT